MKEWKRRLKKLEDPESNYRALLAFHLLNAIVIIVAAGLISGLGTPMLRRENQELRRAIRGGEAVLTRENALGLVDYFEKLMDLADKVTWPVAGMSLIAIALTLWFSWARWRARRQESRPEGDAAGEPDTGVKKAADRGDARLARESGAEAGT